jgi:hypothetical protein
VLTCGTVDGVSSHLIVGMYVFVESSIATVVVRERRFEPYVYMRGIGKILRRPPGVEVKMDAAIRALLGVAR